MYRCWSCDRANASTHRLTRVPFLSLSVRVRATSSRTPGICVFINIQFRSHRRQLEHNSIFGVTSCLAVIQE